LPNGITSKKLSGEEIIGLSALSPRLFHGKIYRL